MVYISKGTRVFLSTKSSSGSGAYRASCLKDIARSIYLNFSDWGMNISLKTKLRLYGNISLLSRVFHGVVFTEAKRKFAFYLPKLSF